MAEKSLEDRARQISQSRLQQGKEFEQLQAAQNQLLEINAAQKQNLGEQAMINSSVAAQNQLLAQAAEVGAMSVGGMRVNPATQATMNRYGLAKPTTISTSKQTVTKQNITINNNTTNINNVPANIGGPIQGRGIQFKDPAGDDGGMSKFRNWIQSAFTKQKEDEVKRNREYARRETSLSKSSNKIMRKLEDFSRDITKRLDPRNISKPIADHFSTVLKLLGMGYLATHTGKILDSIQSFQENTKALWNWISGKSKEKPEFIQKLGESINSFLFGENTVYRPEKGVVGNIVYAFWNDDNTNPGIINRFWNKIKDELETRADLAASAVRGNTDVGKSLKKLDFVGAAEALLDRITTYMTVFLGGKEKGLENVAKNDFSKEIENNRFQGKELKRNHEKDSARRYVLGRMGGEYEELGDTSYGALGYYDEPTRDFENYGRIASGRVISNKDKQLYGNTVSHYLNNNYVTHGGKDIVDMNEAVAGQLQELLVDRELSKSGLGDYSGDAWAGINRLSRFKNRNNNMTLAINTETVDRLLNFQNPGQNAEMKAKMGFKETEYFAIRRQKVLCEYSKEHQKQVLRAMANGYLTGKTGGKVAAGVIGLVVFCIPGVNMIAATAFSLAALGILSGPGMALVNGVTHGLLKEDDQAKNIGTICPKTVDGLIYTWLLYGDFDIYLLKGTGAYGEYTKNQIPASLRKYVSEDGQKITITADKSKIRAAQEAQERETAYVDDEGNIIVNVSEKFIDAFDKNLLQEVIRLGQLDFGKNTKDRVFDYRSITEFNSNELNTIINSYVGGNEDIAAGLNEKNAVLNSDTAGSFHDFWKNSYQNGQAQAIPAGSPNIDNFVSKVEEAHRKSGNTGAPINFSAGNGGNTSIPPLDLESTITSLVSHAQSGSTGWCARHVRSALEDGGMDTTGRPNYGGKYGSWLTENGWEEVTDNSRHVGDIAVTSPFGSHKYGHISMLSPVGNGEYKWVADSASDNASPYGDDDGSHTKIYRYKNIINGNISSLPIFGAKGAYSGESKYRGANDVQHKEGGGVVDFLTSAFNRAWRGSIKTIKAVAVDSYAPSQSWVDSVNGIPLNSSIAPRSISDETKSTISSYFKGSNVAPSWATRANLTGSALKWSKLFNEEGKFLGDMTKLDPEVKTIIERIQTATEKIASNTDEDKEIAKQQLLTSAAIGESTLAAADANSKMTSTAMRTLIANKNNNKPQAISGQESNI